MAFLEEKELAKKRKADKGTGKDGEHDNELPKESEQGSQEGALLEIENFGGAGDLGNTGHLGGGGGGGGGGWAGALTTGMVKGGGGGGAKGGRRETEAGMTMKQVGQVRCYVT